jgi:hypothetical protein
MVQETKGKRALRALAKGNHDEIDKTTKSKYSKIIFSS